MGGGLERNNSAPRRASAESRSLLRAVADLNTGIEASGGAVASKEEYCAREHRLAFTITSETVPATGTQIELTDGDPPRLVGDGGEIGVIDTRQTAIRSCLQGDWAMSGTIAAINPLAGKGVAVVSGQH
jgi:hypothetical protein